MYDEAATPDERSEVLDSLSETIRPNAIVEERHADTTLDCNTAHANAFANYGGLNRQARLSSISGSQNMSRKLCLSHFRGLWVARSMAMRFLLDVVSRTRL